MLAHEWFVVRERGFQCRHVVTRTDVAEYHGRIARESTALRALHRAAFEARAELGL